MRFLKINSKKKKADYLIVKTGNKDTRKYPKKTLLAATLTQEK